jgi:hypothetical protein
MGATSSTWRHGLRWPEVNAVPQVKHSFDFQRLWLQVADEVAAHDTSVGFTPIPQFRSDRRIKPVPPVFDVGVCCGLDVLAFGAARCTTTVPHARHT